MKIYLNELEEKYGKDFAERITEQIQYCGGKSIDFKFEVIEETNYSYTLAFVTSSYTYLYEVSKMLKKVREEIFIGFKEARKVLELMDSF